MTDPTDSGTGHPGLGQATDISAADLDTGSEAPTPATNDPGEFDDDGLGTGDGPDLAGLGGSAAQPGGAG